MGEFFSPSNTSRVGGAALQGVALEQQGRSAEQAGRTTQFLAEREAANVRRASENEAARIRKIGAKIKGKQQAAIAASGVTGGSFLDVLGQTAREAEEEALEILFRGEEASFGLRTRGVLARAAGKQAKKQARLGAISTILSAAAKSGARR